MLSPFQASRLRKHADYGLVYNASRKHRSRTLSFFYRERLGEAAASPEVQAPRFGLTTPRALGPAVLRNRVKRRLRAVAHPRMHLLPPGVDLILHPRPEAATLAFSALVSEIETVFRTVAARVASHADNTPLPRGPRPPKRKPSKPAKPKL